MLIDDALEKRFNEKTLNTLTLMFTRLSDPTQPIIIDPNPQGSGLAPTKAQA